MHRTVILVFLFVLSARITALPQGARAPAGSVESALRAGNFQQAVELAKAELRQSPKNPKLWTMKGIALSRLGQDREALAAYNNALNISPDYLAALEGAAEIEYKAGNKRAAPLLLRILRVHPNDPTSHAMLGVLAYKDHDCESAAKHFAASRDLITSQPAALAQYGSCLMDLQRSNDALSVFQQLLALQPDDPHARYNLAVVQLTAQHSSDAISTLDPLLQSQPPDPDVLDLASSAYEESGDTPKAVDLLHQAIVLDPKKIKYYVDFATIAFNHQSFQVGVDMMNAGLKLIPNAAQLYVARGILYIQLGDFEKGEADFDAASRIDPSQTSSTVAEGLAQIQQSNLDQALNTVESRLKANPKDAFLHYMKAQILFQQGVDPGTPQFKEAIAAASQATELKTDFVLPRDLLGNLYLKSGQIEKSIEQSRRALRDSPSDQEALYHLIQALRQKGADTKGELPQLIKRLAVLRQESRSAEAAGRRYKLYERDTASDGAIK
jgi:tetratricopeptide (TPR) repeat protein